MKINEILAESYSAKVTPDWIFDYIEKLHTGPSIHDYDDEETGTEEWVHQFDYFKLQLVQLNTLSLRAGSNKQDKIDKYALSKEQYPPIVIDGSNDWLIDGYHRANAAIKRGDATIMAYVGVGR